jgi:hypothetical protein
MLDANKPLVLISKIGSKPSEYPARVLCTNRKNKINYDWVVLYEDNGSDAVVYVEPNTGAVQGYPSFLVKNVVEKREVFINLNRKRVIHRIGSPMTAIARNYDHKMEDFATVKVLIEDNKIVGVELVRG